MLNNLYGNKSMVCLISGRLASIILSNYSSRLKAVIELTQFLTKHSNIILGRKFIVFNYPKDKKSDFFQTIGTSLIISN